MGDVHSGRPRVHDMPRNVCISELFMFSCCPCGYMTWLGQEKRCALLAFLRSTQRRAARRSYTLLGKTMCSRAFRSCTGISGSFLAAGIRLALKGCLEWPSAARSRVAPRATEMRDAIWAVVADLNEQNPFAKAEAQSAQSLQSLQSTGSAVHSPGAVWNIPFHQKVCLWRLVEHLHQRGQACCTATLFCK